MPDTFMWKTKASANGTDTINTNSAQFGDGYKQISSNGINAASEKWDLNWIGKKDAAIEVRHFLISHAIDSFWWTNPWGEKKLFRVKADSISYSFLKGGVITLNFTFEQAFAP